MNPKHRHLVIDCMDVEGEEEEWGKGNVPASFLGGKAPCGLWVLSGSRHNGSGVEKAKWRWKSGRP